MRRRTTDKNNIELGSLTEPNIPAIVGELEEARVDAGFFYQKMQQARAWWLATWPGQTMDGRKHLAAIVEADGQDASLSDEDNCFPWEGAADHRPRTVGTIIRDHVMVSEYAFFKAKVQATKIRPMVHPGETTKATRLLRWRLYNHMWAEQLRVIPRVANWLWGYGLAFMGVGWEQSRRLDLVEFTLADLDMVMQARGGEDKGNWLWLLDAIMDPKQEPALATLIQSLSPIVSRPEARKIVRDLREVRHAQLPIAYPYTNKPVLYEMKPAIDCLFPGETVDIQAARWYCDMHEWLSDTEMEDRIETEGWDPGFVEQAKLVAKGEVPEQTQVEPDAASPFVPASGRRKLTQIYHFHFKAIISGTPVLLTTTFNPLVKGPAGVALYAKHGLCYYDHGQYPVVPFARLTEGRRLYDAVGIAEEAYTDEQSIKRQQDGLDDRTALVHRPPMIVPQSKVKAIQGAYRPGAILGVGRAKEVEWGPLPPTDATPIEVMQFVLTNLDGRYPLFGADLDQAKKQIYRDKVSREFLGPIGLAIELTFQNMQQYENPEEIAKVTGEPGIPFHVDKQEIQGKHEISATFDARMLDEDYAKSRMELVGQAMAFKQEGVLYNLAVEAIDPDVAELLQQSETSPAAMEREKAEERQAITNALAGIEDPLPMFGNYPLRIKELLTHTVYSKNPRMKERLDQAPDAVQILVNRVQFMQRQTQQYTQNPRIGRALQHKTFSPTQAPELMNGAAQDTGGGY